MPVVHQRLYELGPKDFSDPPRLKLVSPQGLEVELEIKNSRVGIEVVLLTPFCLKLKKLQPTSWNLILSSSIPFKERHEAVVRRTMERSQKPKQKHNRWSWGGSLHGSPSIHSAGKQ